MIVALFASIGVLGSLALLALSAALWGWLFMLVEGAMADHHILFAHPLGYGVCFLIGIPLSFVLG